MVSSSSLQMVVVVTDGMDALFLRLLSLLL